MKRKLSGLSVAIIVIVTIVTVPLVMVGGSEAMILGGQGGGRPTRSPKKKHGMSESKPKKSEPKSSEPNITAKSRAEQPTVTISALQSLSNYDSSLRDNVYTIVMPNVNANSLSVRSGSVVLRNGSRGTGFDNLQVKQHGNEAFVSFRLQPGAHARISRRTLERFEKLEIFISVSMEAKNVSLASGDNQNTEIVESKRKVTGAALSNTNNAATSRDASIIVPCSGTTVAGGKPIWAFKHKDGALSEIAGKKKVFLNKSPDRIGEKTTLLLTQHSGLEIAETPLQAEFALSYCSWDFAASVATSSSGRIREVHSGTSLLVTINDAPERMFRVIWEDEGEDTHSERIMGLTSVTYASERLTKHFIAELKKARGEPDWDAPFLRDDSEILLPEDFRKRESANAQVWPLRQSLPIFGQQADEPVKPLNTSGSLSDISNKRKVFVNFTGSIGDKIIAKLGTYGGLEVVKTAVEADLAVNLYYWEREERSPPQGLFGEQTVKDVTGATMIVTIRDPSQRIPRIVWRNDDTDGGWLKRGEAYDKLIKRFISEVKKMRGER
jgi:hypothetical protein